jgi:hypothetical protein
MLDFIERHRRNLLGEAKDKTGLVDVVNELHGDATGNATAKAMAQAVADQIERLRLRFNRAGGDIAKRADFGLPHRHDPLKVRSAGFDQWKADLLAEIAPEKMIDPLSGGAFTPERLEEFNQAAFKNISTNGLSEMGGSGGLASRMLANRRSDPRHYVFKSGEAWLRYNAKYGDGNPFEAVMSHVHGMARDISFMEKLGPNPAASWRRMIDRADRIAANSSVTHEGAIKGTSRARYRAEQIWRYMNGDMTVPVLPDGDGLMASIGRGALDALHATRDILTSALLGSAQITSIADVNTNIFARKMNGLPATKVLSGILAQLNPLDASHRKFAVYLAAGVRDATRTMSGLQRWFGDSDGPRWSQVLADDVMRVTGMNKWFEAGRNSFITDYFGQLGYVRVRGFADLPAQLREGLERHGLTADDWDGIRAAEPTKFHGADYVDWHNIAKDNQAVADRLVDAVLREARSAVLETDAESQSLMRAAGRPGTLWGEVAGNTVQFKSFPLALVMDQARRIAEINERRGAWSAAKYGVSFVAGMTLLGMVSMQLKQIIQGKDMLPMDEPKVWWNAFVQGGGAGVIGDIAGSFTQNRVANAAEYIGGPVVTFADEAFDTARSFFKEDAEGETHGGRNAARLARRYTPGTTIWYARLALDRLLWDELAERADPDYADHYDRLNEAAAKNGQDYWWGPGERAPTRAPQRGHEPEQP